MSSKLRSHIFCELPNENALSGLLPIRIRWSDHGAHNLSARVRLAGPTEHTYECEIHTPESSGGEYLLHAHTRLLDNGEYRIKVDVLLEDECVAGIADVITIANRGPIAREVRRSLQEREVPLFFEGFCDSSMYDYDNEDLYPWFDCPPAHQQIADWYRQKRLSGTEASHLEKFVADGYTVLEGLIGEKLIERVNIEIDAAIADGYQGYQWGSSQRITHLHHTRPVIRELWCHPGVMRYLDLVFDALALPCQTLTFVFGSQQDAHQDTIHLTPFPRGYMCGVWVALEDIQPESGELVVYAKSHRAERVTMRSVECGKVKNGDWQEFGEKVPSLSRKSIVTHNFAEGALVYYDSTGSAGTVYLRERNALPCQRVA